MRLLRFLVVLAVVVSFVPASAAAQDDAGSGADAGNTFQAFTHVPSHGRFEGRLDREAGDTADYYGFALAEGENFSVLVKFVAPTTDPLELLDPNGIIVDTGMRYSSVGVAYSNAFTAASTAFSSSDEVAQVRLSVQHAPTAGEYRLHLQAQQYDVNQYMVCVMNCDEPFDASQDTIFGGSLKNLETKVLLVPPVHGDLGNPLGPTVLDYINATLRGIHRWSSALDAFATRYPEFAYLRQIKIEIEVFDGAHPVDPAGYDVMIGYVAAGPAFRGVATDADSDSGIEDVFGELGVHYSGRFIALSLFGSSPRAGQVLYDFPESNDLENVTMHEFGHTFGLGHTRMWTTTYGGDLMNSPAYFVYGDGSPAGDGGERTPLNCLSSLNLSGMAELYRWIPEGHWQPSFGDVQLPSDIPYEWFCDGRS